MKQTLAPFVWSAPAQALERTQVLSSKCGLPVKDFAGDQSLKLLLVHLLSYIFLWKTNSIFFIFSKLKIYNYYIFS